MSNSFPANKVAQVDSLIPYARNSRTHSPDQVDKIAASIREFGFLNPVIVDGEHGIIAGHGRVLAARKLGMTEVPVIEAAHLSEAQRRAYIIADNRLALDAGWDDELLKVELDDLAAMGFDLALTGFEVAEIDAVLEGHSLEDPKSLSENYSRKIEAPIYEITGDCPQLSELVNRAKVETLRAEIDAADIPAEVAEFLRHAAERHAVFNFRNIAEFYAHADAKVQDLMERSALVIIDFDKAVENGFVSLSKALMEMAGQEHE